MRQTLSEIDPQWAWAPYQPDDRQPWDRRRAAHLFRRAGFGATSTQLDETLRRDPQQVVRQLVHPPVDEAQERELETLERSLLASGKPQSLPAGWLYRMLHASDVHREKRTLFWHGHFATSLAKVEDPERMAAQVALFRDLGGGPFEPLVQAISRDPAMLVYLDSATNRKSHPNENYARELMELFCLGVGNYTERDVQELARCFTGWEVTRSGSRLNPLQHDLGAKMLLGRAGNFDSREAVQVVVAHEATPRFLTDKLVRSFVCDEPALPAELLAPLAADFRDHDLDTTWLVERILSSRLFFSEFAIGRKMRSPVDLAIGLLRSLEGTTNLFELAAGLAALGQAVYSPPSVKGWDGGRSWINSATLLGRANLVGSIVHHGQSRFAGGDLALLADHHGRHSAAETVDWLLELLVAVPVPADVRERLVALAGESSASRGRQLARVVQAVGALPEFQIG